MLAGLERFVNLWIHVDGHVLIIQDLCIPLGNLPIDPLLEGLSNYSIDYICNILDNKQY